MEAFKISTFSPLNIDILIQNDEHETSKIIRSDPSEAKKVEIRFEKELKDYFEKHEDSNFFMRCQHRPFALIAVNVLSEELAGIIELNEDDGFFEICCHPLVGIAKFANIKIRNVFYFEDTKEIIMERPVSVDIEYLPIYTVFIILKENEIIFGNLNIMPTRDLSHDWNNIDNIPLSKDIKRIIERNVNGDRYYIIM